MNINFALVEGALSMDCKRTAVDAVGALLMLGLGACITGYSLLAIVLSVVMDAKVREAIECTYVNCLWLAVKTLFEDHQYLNIQVTGQELCNSSAVIISNHLSKLDYFVLGCLSQRCNLNGRCNFFVWRHCVKFPDLRMLLCKLKYTQNWAVRPSELQRKLRPVTKSELPFWLIIFPEVDKLSESILIKNTEASKQNKSPVYYNLLAPRFPAFRDTISLLRKTHRSIFIYDATFKYWGETDKNGTKEHIDRAPTITDILFNRNTQWFVCIHVNQVLMDALPKKKRKLDKWLEKTWISKDKKLNPKRRMFHKRPKPT